MDYEKPVFLDTKLNEVEPEATPMGFIVVVAVLVAGVAVILGGAVGAVVAAAGAGVHVAAGVNTVAAVDTHTVTTS